MNEIENVVLGAAESAVKNVVEAPAKSASLYMAIFAVIVILLLGFTTYYFHGRYQGEVISYTVLQDKDKQIMAVVDQNNATIEQMQKDVEARKVRAAQYVAQANLRAKRLEKKAQDVLLTQPASGVSACGNVDKLFNDYIGGVK